MTNPDDHAPPVTLARDGHIAVVTLDRADKLNAQTLAMWRQLAEIGAELVADDTVRVAVVRGAGRSFSAGLDPDRHGHTAGQRGSGGAIGRGGPADRIVGAGLDSVARRGTVPHHRCGAGSRLRRRTTARASAQTSASPRPTAKLAAMEAKYSLVRTWVPWNGFPA